MRIVAAIILFIASLTPFMPKALAQSSLIEVNDSDSFEDELRTPEVPRKLRDAVKAHMNRLAEELYRDGIDVELMRNGEIVIVNLPTDELFAPNEVELSPLAPNKLYRFNRYFNPLGRYKIILAVHCDDTGSEEYALDLSEARVNAIIDYFEQSRVDVEHLIGYAKGSSSPIVDNLSRANRALNRRLEIYIIPDTRLLDELKGAK